MAYVVLLLYISTLDQHTNDNVPDTNVTMPRVWIIIMHMLSYASLRINMLCIKLRIMTQYSLQQRLSPSCV